MGKDSQQMLDLPGGEVSVPVLVPTPLDRAFSYAVPKGQHVAPGQIVQIPLGPRKVAGVVWDGEADQVDPKKLRPIEVVFDCPPLDKPMRSFIDWVSRYTLSPPNAEVNLLNVVPGPFG